jgi:hypothetical protein
MLASEQFRMRMRRDARLMLDYIASHERRTRANVVDVLIREKYKSLNLTQVNDVRLDHAQDQIQKPAEGLVSALGRA